MSQAEESVLSSGTWYKLAIPQSGIYKLDAAYLSDQNITIPSGHKIHIYGQQGGMLPEAISEYRTDDLVAFPLLEVNVDSGPLSSNSAIYFYAESPDKWKINNYFIDYQKNIYDINNYVFITFRSNETLKITNSESILNPEYTSSSYLEIQRYEVDKANPLGIFPTTHGSGQEWYGDEFSNLRSKGYATFFDIDDIVLDAPMRVISNFVGRSDESTTYELLIDNHVLTQRIGSVRTGDIEAIHARKASIDEEILLNTSQPEIILNYPSVSSTSKGWLDFIELRFQKELKLKDKPIFIRDLESVNYDRVSFEFQSPLLESTEIWNISDSEKPQKMTLEGNSFSFDPKEKIQSFLAFDKEHIQTPQNNLLLITNQNLHGIVDADLIIIYYKIWKKEAERLAQHRRSYSGLNVETVDIEKIYNEFSSGRQDPTAIRDFARMIRSRSENFKYLLLFGDGSYDFRGIDPTQSPQSFVPTYETPESLDPLEAFPSDDYFAQLDEDEGLELRGDLDIAVGRLPARTIVEAENLVNKLISYDLNKNAFGEWRSRIAFLADDEDSNLHLNDADVIATRARKAHPLFNQKKIYWDAFIQESTPGGNRYPSANAQLNTDIEDGLLVINYLGHGGPKGWSQERVLNLDDITSWSNLEKLPLVITATCSFTGFDDPSLTTAGEATIHNPTGGAVGLFTTVRSVYASQNFRLTSAVFDTIFTKVDGEYMTIGEVMQSAKNTRPNDIINARKFFLIGDPSMKLAIPLKEMKTLHFNDKEVGTQIDTIGAQQKITGSVNILNFEGNPDTEFNGEAVITLFDKTSDVKTLRNDQSSFEKSFELQKNILYKGRAKVENGLMTFEFIIPLDIDYSYGNGRLSYYAVSDNGEDAAGYFDNFVIGGTAQNPITDNEGPEIHIFLNSKNFISGQEISNSNPTVIADFFDESGINVSNVSIGHEIVSIVDEDTRTTQVHNQQYISEVDDFKRGSLNYRLVNLAPGLHSLTFRAFDVLNNVGSAKVEFEVVENLKGFLQSVFAHPNPFYDQINFNIENELGENVNLELKIFTPHGQLIHSITRNGITNDGSISNLHWDGFTGSGGISSGLYFYEVLLVGKESGKRRSSGLKTLIYQSRK